MMGIRKTKEAVLWIILIFGFFVTIGGCWVRSLLHEDWIVIPLFADWYTGIGSNEASFGIFFVEWPPGDWFAKPPGYTTEVRPKWEEHTPNWWGEFDLNIILPHEGFIVIPWWWLLVLLTAVVIVILFRKLRCIQSIEVSGTKT